MPSQAHPTIRLDTQARLDRYSEVRASIRALLEDESDWIAALATIVAELHNAFPHFDWTGFYRVIAPEQLAIGPYQGGHGCLRIAFSRGICGAAARTQTTQLVPDVSKRPDHIACASTTQSEIVVPVLSPNQEVLAVLDIDSNHLSAFDDLDQQQLELICQELGEHFPDGDPATVTATS